MTTLTLLGPGEPGPCSAPALIAALQAAPAGSPFSPERLALAEDLSQSLLAHPQARTVPELVALAFFLRRSALQRLQQEFQALHTPETLLVPRGLAFHIPPTNVDTIAVYAWALSMLVGNHDLVRLSSRSSPLGELLLAVLLPVLDRAPAGLRSSLAFVRYGHEEQLTATFSAGCDLRIVWGSDETVRSVRAAPVPPSATELVFFDRWSFCLLSTAAWRALDPPGRQRLAEGLFNDAWPFGQQGCASPRMLVWVGEGALACGQELGRALVEVLDARGWQPDASQVSATTAFAWACALDLPVQEIQHLHPGLWLIGLGPVEQLPRSHPGGGLLFQLRLNRLQELLPLVQRKDQTMTCFGFDSDELRGLAAGLGSRCPDRIVPVGQALSFHRYWDGHDLLAALSRRVHLPVPA